MNSIFLTDAYKTGHQDQYPEGTTLVFSNFTPRANKYAPQACKDLNGVVVFGVQLAIKKIVEHFDENFFFTKERGDENFSWNAGNLVELKKRAIDPIRKELSLFLASEYDTTHFEKLWDLGYLPLEIRSLEEGTLCPIRVPMLTIHNTESDFYWLPNFLETILSQFLWKPMTSATIALSYRKILEKWANKTNPEGKEFVLWQGHDFSMRGLDAVEATIASGLGHLTSFHGSDSLPVLWGARHYYNETGFVAGSVPATEHSVMCAGSKDDEMGTFKRLLGVYPVGILSVVSDTWDLWKVLTDYLPRLKQEILAREGKLVIRPDSGDPVDILCGYEIEEIEAEDYETFLEIAEEKLHEILSENTPHGEYGGDYSDLFKWNDKIYDVNYDPDWNRHDKQYYFIDNYGGNKTTAVEIESKPEMKGVIELLWDVFGGTVNEQGYKALDSHIGAIYGDSITHERAEEICRRLEAKGFASTNVVFGIGSYTYQYNTRDTYGFAMKATYVEKVVGFNNLVGGLLRTPVTEGFEIFKDPITDDGLKKSARGLIAVVSNPVGGEPILVDQCSWETVNSEENLLKLVFQNGELLQETTLTEIRERLNKLV